jgi:hypothetical protein
MTRANQILLIKAILDELPSGFEGMIVTNSDPKPLDFYINQILDDSADESQRLIPRHLLQATIWIPAILSIVNGKAVVNLPIDYVRLADIQFTSWLYPCHDEISLDNPNHHLQHNPYTRGGVSKPVCVRIPGPLGSPQQMECYSVLSTDTATGHYIPKYTRDVNNMIQTFYDDLGRFVGWYTAMKLAQIFQNDKAAQYCLMQFEQLIKINTL